MGSDGLSFPNTAAPNTAAPITTSTSTPSRLTELAHATSTAAPQKTVPPHPDDSKQEMLAPQMSRRSELTGSAVPIGYSNSSQHCGKRVRTNDMPPFRHSPNAGRRTSSGLSSLKCRWCDKAFRYPSEVKTHERTHTGEKPYSCKFCARPFSASSNLRRHERRHAVIDAPDHQSAYQGGGPFTGDRALGPVTVFGNIDPNQSQPYYYSPYSMVSNQLPMSRQQAGQQRGAHTGFNAYNGMIMTPEQQQQMLFLRQMAAMSQPQMHQLQQMPTLPQTSHLPKSYVPYSEVYSDHTRQSGVESNNQILPQAGSNNRQENKPHATDNTKTSRQL